jgi:hypothetical protein
MTGYRFVSATCVLPRSGIKLPYRLAKKVIAVSLVLTIAVVVYDYGYVQGRSQTWVAAAGLVAKDQSALITEVDRSMAMRPASMSADDKRWSDALYADVVNRRIDMNSEIGFPVPFQIIVALLFIAAMALVVDLSVPLPNT